MNEPRAVPDAIAAPIWPTRNCAKLSFRGCVPDCRIRLKCSSPLPASKHCSIESLAGALDQEPERVVQAIHLTINGIAAGLRNSG